MYNLRKVLCCGLFLAACSVMPLSLSALSAASQNTQAVQTEQIGWHGGGGGHWGHGGGWGHRGYWGYRGYWGGGYGYYPYYSYNYAPYYYYPYSYYPYSY